MPPQPQLTSTTAPGKTFASRSELADHYKSDWHKYNLKRREAGLPLLAEPDFHARLEAALALRMERQGRDERTGTDHLKKKKNKKQSSKMDTNGGVTVKVQAAAYERIRDGESVCRDDNDDMAATDEQASLPPQTTSDPDSTEQEPSPVIDPRQCLFDKHMSTTVDANLERMQRKYGFFVPDQEYLVDKKGLLGYCHEKIKLGHYCLYCQRTFRTWQGCQKHMISTRHTKLRYERGVDLDEFDPFYDFAEADTEFLTGIGKIKGGVEDVELNEEDDDQNSDEEWMDVSDDEEMDEFEDESTDVDEDHNLYAGYEEEIARMGYDVTPLGELVFPDGRIVGHRGLARYYKQRLAPNRDRAAVIAARQAAGERLYRGRVYNIGSSQQDQQRASAGGESSTLALARAGVSPSTTSGRAGNGVLVSTGSGGFTAVSLYRYKAVVQKARRDEARGQRLQNKTKQNMNRMDKKGNRLMNAAAIIQNTPR